MAVTVSDIGAEIERCVDDCTRDMANQLAVSWRVEARRLAPVGLSGEYKASFQTPEITPRGNAEYTVTMRNSARHASYIEQGWVSRPGKVYANPPYPFGAVGDGRWGHGQFAGGNGPVCQGLRAAVRFIS